MKPNLKAPTLSGYLFVATLLAGGGFAPVVSAQIYTWVDSEGITHYTNRRPVGQKVRVIKCRTHCFGRKRSVDWSNVPLITDSYVEEVYAAADRYGVDPWLVRAVIHAESGFRATAVSDMGAQGLMQLMPAKQKEYGVTQPFDPGQNIDAGVRYLRFLLDKFEGDRRKATAGYNAGENAVVKYDGVPPFDETREFVRRVKILEQRYARVM